MTVADIESAQPKDGTGGGLIAMLDFAIRTGVLTAASGKALKTGATKVLEIEQDWALLDVVSMDEDEFLRRFANLRRDAFSDGTKDAYKQRFRQARAMYIARLNGEKDWSAAGPTPRQSAPATRSRSAKASPGTPDATRSDTAAGAIEAGGDGVQMVAHSVLIRRNVFAKLTLPADLTTKEAARIAAVVSALAFDEQLALPAASS